MYILKNHIINVHSNRKINRDLRFKNYLNSFTCNALKKNSVKSLIGKSQNENKALKYVLYKLYLFCKSKLFHQNTKFHQAMLVFDNFLLISFVKNLFKGLGYILLAAVWTSRLRESNPARLITVQY